MSTFVHLHTHSHYSLLNALPLIKELVSTAKADGMNALALTDAGNMYGAVEFYMECEKQEIKPIIGVDFYVAARTRHDREPGIDNKRHRLVLLAENDTGYKNLIKLVTASNLEGFYYKPRIDHELMQEYSDGLIAILPSFSGETTNALKNTDTDKAKEILEQYYEWYGRDNVFLEISHHPEIDGHMMIQERIKDFARETGAPLVAAHDVYYMKPEDRTARETLIKIQGTGGGNWDDGEEDFSFITQETAEEYFREEPSALANTIKIADRCNLEIEMKWTFPDYIIESGRSADDELEHIVHEGITWRGLSYDDPEVKERIDFELDVIKMKGYAVYFLAVGDLLREARERKILTTIRGSVAGSLVTYVLGITNVNPLEYKLPFERFLNPERPSAPDIDMDFADDRRDEIIQYTREKYGADNVAQIGTFGTMMARACVRDVARALGHPYAIGDKIAKLIPMGSQGFPMTIDSALEMTPELQELYDNDEEVKEVLDLGKKIEGHARHVGVHAAGVVIAPKPLTEYVPLQYDPKTIGSGEGKLITQYDMRTVGEDGVGLLKFDFLGIKNLAILADAVKRAEENHGVTIDIENVDVADQKTFAMLARGETMGLFQLSGAGMTKYLKDLKPTTIHDINAMVALYRPGPMEMIPQYIERKHNPQLISYLDPRLEEILDRSYGVITYQDDVMMTAIKLAGYSWLEADKLRKAMGKKIPEVMAEQKKKLLIGFVENGMSRENAKQLWQLIEPFAAYGFNKCVTGDTRIHDATTGKICTVAELYTSSHTITTLALDAAEQKIVFAPVSAVMQNGVKHVYELLTRSGKRIKATNNHPFLTFHGWKQLGELSVGERIAAPRTIPNPISPVVSNPHHAAVIGYLLAEGNLCHPHGIYFYSKEDAEIEDFIAHCSHFDNAAFTINRSKPATSVYIKRADLTAEHTLRSYLASLDLIDKNALNKHIPAELFSWDNDSLAMLLGKMWQGDGTISITNEQLFYATSSEQLATDVQLLLLRFSILSTIHTKKFKYRGTIRVGYTVVITHRENISRFWKCIGRHLVDRKQKTLHTLYLQSQFDTKYLARGTKDTIPADIIELMKCELHAHGRSAISVASQTGLAVRLFYSDTRKKGYQRNVIKQIAKSVPSPTLMMHAQSDVFWDEVVSITPIGKEMTYDLTVPEHHNFIANGLITHNSHAASYGRVAYQTAYMKANYPVEYMAAILTADSGDVEKIGEAIHECERMGIPVLPPDINESYKGFTVVRNEGEKPAIRFGLVTIKNFGEGIADAIISERETNGKFKSIEDFLERVLDRNLNKKSLESLIKAGAFDATLDRSKLFNNLDALLAYNKEIANKPDHQDSLFAGLAINPNNLRLIDGEPISDQDRLAWEKELLGLYISGHPLDRYKEQLEKHPVDIEKALTAPPKVQVVVYGIVEEVKTIVTKKGDQMAFLRVADKNNVMEAVCFSDVFKTHKENLNADVCVGLKGKMTDRNGEKSMIIEKMKILN